jgi:hypothetical protein
LQTQVCTKSEVVEERQNTMQQQSMTDSASEVDEEPKTLTLNPLSPPIKYLKLAVDG